MKDAPTTLFGTRFGIIADAHIHPEETPPFPEELKKIFGATDAIIVLGDMGESSGLDWLEAIAPVHGVRGGDDAKTDPRVQDQLKLFVAGDLAAGAVFDGASHGLLSSNDPLTPLPDLADAAERVFGRKIDILLCAASHRPFAGSAQGILIVNPGSPTLAERRSVATLRIDGHLAQVEHHYFA